MKLNDEMPDRVEYQDGKVPAGLDLLYETKSDDSSIWMELTPGGHAYRRVRQAIADNPHSPTIPGQVIRTTREDWTATIAVAKPAERKLLLKMAALDRVKFVKPKA